MASANVGNDLNWLPFREIRRQTPLWVRQRPEPVPFDLENPLWMGERVTDTTERHGLELREGHFGQYNGSSATSFRRYHVAVSPD